ncbi:MAG: aminotransferase class I/II-fold pyridoxal phosphate-dependent enzyme [Pseudomonadota bacterium]
MRNFELEVFFSQWEFTARHHMTASDIESLSVSELLAYGDEEDKASLESLWLGYTETWGAPDLRAEIASTYNSLASENVLCMAGAGEGIYAGMKVLLNSDDHVIVPVPNYQSAETVPLSICAVSGVALQRKRCAQSTSGSRWYLDIDDVKAAIRPNTKVLSLNFPHNPTGMLLAHDELQALVALCRTHGITIFNDEVYRGVELNEADRMPQIADVYEHGVSLNVMSKAYGLPGVRVGWLASKDTAFLQRAERYKHYLSICNSAPSERLALIALKARDALLERNRQILKRNVVELDSLFAAFPRLFAWEAPQGGCVAYPEFLGPEGSDEFCRALIEKSGVLLLPSSIYASELVAAPENRFRIGFGRDQVFTAGLAAMREHLQTHYAAYSD